MEEISYIVVTKEGKLKEFIVATLHELWSDFTSEHLVEPTALIMHPDDWEKLERSLSKKPSFPSFGSIPVLIDEDAPEGNFYFE